jgi:hypothetical protein
MFLQKIKGAIRSRIFMGGSALTILGLLEQFVPGILSEYVPNEYSGMAIAFVGLFFTVVRWVMSGDADLESKVQK